MDNVIKEITFDYFGVIATNFLHRSPDLRDDQAVSGMVHDLNLGLRGWQSFALDLSKKLRVSPDQLIEQYYDRQIDPLIVGFIRGLKPRYKIGLLTNTSDEFIEPFLVKHHLRKLFDDVVISAKIGLLKPDVRIYQYFAQQAGLLPQQILFIDDSQKNIVAAESIGMMAIQYVGYEALQSELEKKGII
jgi:epoxide hydrolase-like predicted phosphatase